MRDSCNVGHFVAQGSPLPHVSPLSRLFRPHRVLLSSFPVPQNHTLMLSCRYMKIPMPKGMHKVYFYHLRGLHCDLCRIRRVPERPCAASFLGGRAPVEISRCPCLYVQTYIHGCEGVRLHGFRLSRKANKTRLQLNEKYMMLF